MNRYIVIQHAKAKTRLKSTFSKTGLSKLKFGNGRSIEYSPVCESEMCTMVYTPTMRQDMVNWLNKLFGDLGPDEIDDFFEQFKLAHPLTSVQNVSSEDLMIASKNRYCELSSPLFANLIKLTEEQESVLVNIVNMNAIDRKYMRITAVMVALAMRYDFILRGIVSIMDLRRVIRKTFAIKRMIWHGIFVTYTALIGNT